MRNSKIKVLVVFLSVCFAFSLFPSRVDLAATVIAKGTCGAKIKWSLSDNGTLTISGSGAMSDYIGVGQGAGTYADDVPWRNYRNQIKNVVFSGSITTIGGNAFCDCTQITSITIPNTVTVIRDFAFDNCKKLSSVTISTKATTIGMSAFAGCSSLREITIPASVKTIGSGAFRESGLESIVIPSGVTVISKSLFENCENLREVTIAGNITSIGDSAFAYTPISEINIPATTKTIGPNAFNYCSNLYKVTIPNSVTSIGYSAFSDCVFLSEVTISSGVTTISEQCFAFCYELNKVNIPDSVTKIEDRAFNGCDGLKSIVIPESVTEIGSGAFNSCRWLKSVVLNKNAYSQAAFPELSQSIFHYYYGVTYANDGNGTISGKTSTYGTDVVDFSITPKTDYVLNKVTLTDSNKSVELKPGKNGKYTMPDADTSATVKATFRPENMSGPCGSNLEWAFDNDSTLTITGSGDMTNWTSLNEVPWYDVRDKIKTVYISGDVTSIGNFAFGGCTSLTDLYYENSGENWNKVVVGSNNEPLSSTRTHFTYTIKVSPVTHGEVKTTADKAFAGEEISVSVTPDSGYITDPIKVNGNPITGNKFKMPSENVEVTVTFRKPVTSGTCGSNLSWSYDDGTLTISGSGKMYNFTDLNDVPWKDVRYTIHTVVLSDKMTSIGNYAFADCYIVDYVEIPSCVTEIGVKAFENTGLIRIIIPDGVESIGNSAFGNCKELESVVLNQDAFRQEAFPGLPSTAFHYYFDIGYAGDGHGTVSGKTRTYGTDILELTINPDEYYSLDKITLSDGNKTVVLSPYSPGKYQMPDMNQSATLSASFRTSVLSGTCGDNLTWEFAGDTLTITGSGNMYDFAGVGDSGPGGPNDDCPWKDCRNCITTVVFSGNVTSIGVYAFTGCSKLNFITIPATVTSIGSAAFGECAFETFTIPDTVKQLGGMVFYDCKSLKNATLPSGITKIGDGMFYGCTQLTSVSFPNKITSIGNRAFEDCIRLASFSIPDSVTSIGRSAFERCTALTSIIIPNGVTSVGEEAFYGCKKLKQISIPASLTEIGDAAFQSCGIEDITIPSGMTSISENTFKSCSNLKKVVLPDAEVSLGKQAFANNASLSSVILNKSSYNDAAFTGCASDIYHYYYDVSYTNDGHGTVSGKKRSYGTDVLEFEVVPDAGYVVDKVTVTSEGKTVVVSTNSQASSLSRSGRVSNKAVFARTKSSGDSYTYTMPDSDNGAVVKVTFKKLYIVKSAENANGTVSFSKTSACAGEEITINATPNTCYATGEIKVNGETITGNKFTMPEADVTVEVTFNELPHDLDHVAAKDATCTEKGHIEYWKCTKCGQLFKDSEGKEKISEGDTVVAALGHDLKCHEETAPTKDAAGNFEYYECDRCHKCFKDAKGTQEVSKDDMVIPAMKHELTHVAAKAATCTEAGNVEYYVCKDADCLIESGGCGKKYSDKYGLNEVDDVTIPATGHHTQKVEAKAPTCTGKGNIEYWKCPDCGHLFKDSEATEEIEAKDTVIAALGHDPKHIEAKAETYLKDGNKEHYECQRDGCHKKFWDEECTEEASDAEIIIPAIGAAELDEVAIVGDLKYKVTYPATDGTGTVSVIGVENKTATVVIPSTVEIKESNYKVNRIAAKAFYGNKIIRTLSIGANVRYIDNYAFYGCSNLIKVAGGKYLETIGSRAFAYCKKLKVFSIASANLRKIGAYAFYKDKKLKTIYIKNTIRLTKAGVKKSLKGSSVKKVKVKKAKVKAYKKIFKKSNSGRKVKVKK